MSNAGELHVTKKTPLGGVPYGKVVSQILCSDEGKMWWRQFAGPRFVNGQIVTVTRDGGSPSLASFPDKLPPRDLEYTVSDIFAKDGTLYVAAATVEGPQLMRYRLADRKFEDAVPFDDRGSTVLNADGNLTVSKIGVLPDGGLVVLGSRALRTDRKTVRFTPVVELYTQGGLFAKSIAWDKDKPSLTSDDGKGRFDSQSVDLAIVTSAPDGIYFGISSGRKVNVLRVSAAGEMEKVFDLPLKEGFRATSMQMTSGQLVLKSVTDSGTPQMLHLGVYSGATGDQLTSYELESKLGALGCSGGRSQFTFVTFDNIGQRFLVTAEP